MRISCSPIPTPAGRWSAHDCSSASRQPCSEPRSGQFEPATDAQGKIRRDPDGNPILRPVLTFHDLRHTFGTQTAAAGVPLRTLQAWMGHEDITTTMMYADYMPAGNEAEIVGQAMKGIVLSPVSSPILSETQRTSEPPNPVKHGA